jgi:hypothetical protein
LTVGQLRSLRISELGTPWGVHNDAQGLRLESFKNFNVGGGSSAPELYTVGPDGFEYGLKLKLIDDRRSVGQSILVSGSHLEAITRFLLSV